MFLEFALQNLLEMLHALNWHVSRLITHGNCHILGVDKRLFEHSIFLCIAELAQSSLHEAHVSLAIWLVDQTILPDTVALVSPHADQTERIAFIQSSLRKHHVLDNIGEVSQVELVMELLSGRHELRSVCHRSEHNHCRVDDLRAKVLANLVESTLFHVVFENLAVDRFEDVFFSS